MDRGDLIRIATPTISVKSLNRRNTMHSLRTIIKINQQVAKPTRDDICSQVEWVLSLLTIPERSQFIYSGRLPDDKRRFSASRGIDVPLLEASALAEARKWNPRKY